MKATEHFKTVIEDFLIEESLRDEAFAVDFEKPHKNMEQCIKYILSEVKKSGCNGFDDAEIFGMAVKYYQDDTITEVENTNCRVAINHALPADAPKAETPKVSALPKKTAPPTKQTTLELF